MHGYAVSLHVCVWGRVSAQKHKKKVMKTLSPWDNRGIAAVYPRTVPSSLVPIHRVPSVVKVNASRENPDLAAVKPAIVSPSLNCVHRVPSASIMATTRCMIGMSKWNLNVSSKYNILLLVLVLSIQSVVCTHTINPNTALPLFVSRCIYIYIYIEESNMTIVAKKTIVYPVSVLKVLILLNIKEIFVSESLKDITKEKKTTSRTKKKMIKSKKKGKTKKRMKIKKKTKKKTKTKKMTKHKREYHKKK